jgi:uncharacterized protein
VKTVACPRCGAPTPYSPQNKWRPFCSERCKIIDLGAWAAESYRVPTEDQRSPDEEPSATPRGS